MDQQNHFKEPLQNTAFSQTNSIKSHEVHNYRFYHLECCHQLEGNTSLCLSSSISASDLNLLANRKSNILHSIV